MYPNDDVDYARMRLVETIIRYEEQAVEVIDVTFKSFDKPLSVEAINLITQQVVRDDIDKFDLTPVKLGFVNLEAFVNTAYYERKPKRQDWRQGFRKANANLAWGFNWWDTKAIAKTINGVFPKVDEAIAAVRGDAQYMAWNRDFCVNGMKHIFYRFYGKIGNFTDKEGKEFLLDEKFYWVEESLKEALA
jgi:hypothetical protein